MFSKLTLEGNFMDKVKDNLSIMNTLNTYFNTLDESLMKNFGNKPNSYDYTKYVEGGKKTRKSRRKVKQRKTKKRI